METKQAFKNTLLMFMKIIAYAKKYFYFVILFFILTGIYSLTYQGRVVLLKPFLDKGLVDSSWSAIIKMTLIMLFLSFMLPIVRYFKDIVKGTLLLKILVAIRNDICAQVLKQAISFFNKRKAGDFFSRMTNDVVISRSAINFILGDIIEQPLMVVGAFGAAFYFYWPLATAALILFPVFALPLIKMGGKVKKSQKKSLVKLADVTESLYQIVTGIRIVKSYNMEDAEKKEFNEQNKSFFRRSMKVIRTKAVSEGVVEWLQNILIAVAIYVTGYLVVHNYMSIGTCAGFVASMIALNRPVRVFAKAYNKLQESLAGCERVFELIEAKPEIQDIPNAKKIDKIDQIQIKNLSFKYEDEMVLKDINITANRGDIIAVVGASGAGKSTLLDLISKFYIPQEGEIIIDDLNLNNIDAHSYLNCIALVGQEPFLFNTSIKENIGYGKPGATDEEIIQAAKQANIHDFILTLPKQYDENVGDRGALLSGGQKQRIAIARAIIRNPHLLLLDEATSALDSESEKLVQDALTLLMKGRTTFVIAHRLSTIKFAKLIIVLDKGQIIEQGKHDELLKKKGLYAKLYHYQFD